jgi:hypothetical protein
VSSKDIPVATSDTEYPADHEPLDYEQTFVIEPDGTVWKIGDEASSDLKERQNVFVEEQLRERSTPFGPIPGVKTGTVTVAWNNEHRILYIEALDPAVRTPDGLHIGMRRHEVLEVMGTPQAVGSDFVRYLNPDLEPIWVRLQFDQKGYVSRMMVYLYM